MPDDGPDGLRAVALVCTLEASPTRSSTQLLTDQLLDALRAHRVTCESVRVIDHDVRTGVKVDMGDGDAWPRLRGQLLASDIVVLATPIWMGQHSSVCQRVLERLDAELSETDSAGRLLTYGKVAVGVIVGNEDGAHHVSGVLFQALSDVGFTVPAQGVTYWHDDAKGEYRNYKDLPEPPQGVLETNKTVAAHAAHLARLLKSSPYPPTD